MRTVASELESKIASPTRNAKSVFGPMTPGRFGQAGGSVHAKSSEGAET